MNQIESIERPVEVPDEGVMCDLLWADPDHQIRGWAPNSARGISFRFGADVVKQFLEQHNLELICRAHEVADYGFEFFANRGLVTLFSAPNYCGDTNNKAAIMSVNHSLKCSFQVSSSFLFVESFMQICSSLDSKARNCAQQKFVSTANT